MTMENDEFTEELMKLGRHDLIHKNVGTVDQPPQHYNVGVEPVKYITSHGLGFLEGNIIKYITCQPVKYRPYCADYGDLLYKLIRQSPRYRGEY